MARERRDIKFQVVLSETESEMLGRLAHKLSLNKSIVLRQALLNHYTMVEHGRPTCADGRACACPQFVMQQAKPAPEDMLRQDAAAAGEDDVQSAA